MASSAKPTGTKSNTTSAKKPATIDLDAKEVGKEADAKTQATVKGKPLGRPDSSSSKNAESSEKDKKSTAETASKKEDVKKTDAPEKAPKETSKQAPAKSSGSFFGKLTSAFMGGVAALVGFGAIGLWDGARELPIIGNFYGGSQSSAVDASQFEALKAEIAELKQSSSNVPDINPVLEKLATLETQVSGLTQNAGSGSPEVTDKLAALEQDFGTLTASFAELTATAADGSTTSPVALSAAIGSLDKRLDTLEVNLGAVAESVASNPALDKVSEGVSTLQNQVGEISQSVTSLREITTQNQTSLQSLSEQSSTLEETVASVKASEKVARSVAVNALATALENDDALTLPISSIKALIGSTPETMRLEVLNANGIPTRKSLVEGLDAFTATIRNPNAPPEDGSIADRFWANAQNMVSFRASGPREGDDPLSILSRVKANVDEDALEQAKAEWEKLPQDIQEQGASWAESVNARLEAFALQNALNQKLSAEAG